MNPQMTALDWPRTFFIDDCGEIIPQEQPDWASSLSIQGHNDNDPTEAALNRGFIVIRRWGADVLVFLRPDRVGPVTLAGAIDVLVRLEQDWTIVQSSAPGVKVEWFRGYMPAIHRITTLLQEAGRLPACPDYADILAETLQFDGAEPARNAGVLKYTSNENIIHFP